MLPKWFCIPALILAERIFNCLQIHNYRMDTFTDNSFIAEFLPLPSNWVNH